MSGRGTRAAYVAFAWALFTGVVHAFWVVAYFYWPAFGRVTLGPDFERLFGRPAFRVYDLVVAVLFVVAALLALAVTRPTGAGLPRWFLVSGIWTATALLFLPGAAAVIRDTLVMFGIVTGEATPLMFYDFWFLLGGSLFATVGVGLRQRT